MMPKFEAGENIAIKVPPHQFDKTVSFYKDIIKLEEINLTSPGDYDAAVFKFGDKNLWIDKMSATGHAEIWLEIKTDNAEKAAQYFDEYGVARRDEIESLPVKFKGFWISSPSNIIHLVCESE